LDAYLDIAAKILRAERRPLSPEAMLTEAYRRAVVPPHLHGRTQHKTLQARISEDIIHRGEHSLFIRTAPGRFFLREFLTDAAIPEEFRRPFPTRRRFRELIRGPALALEYDVLKGIADENTEIEPQKIFDLLNADRYSYEDPRVKKKNFVFLRSFVCVYRAGDILTYRLGRYREDRDKFMSRRSVGFWAFVHRDEHTLFNLEDFGIVDSGVQATKIDLDVPEVPTTERVKAALRTFIWSTQGGETTDLLAVIKFECPTWFEPTKRRLALNDLTWLDATIPVNDIDDFDPWSQIALLAHYRACAGMGGGFESYPRVPGQAKRRVPQISD
jgi:HB1, ASXL, restriction endonuclease HTH domain